MFYILLQYNYLRSFTRLEFSDMNEDVLLVTFGQTEGSDDVASEELGSIMCMYSMATIRDEFFRSQKYCYRGQGMILKWINDKQHCTQDVRL